MANVIRKTFSGLKGLLSGMGLTLWYFLRFDKVITQQYPENRDTLKLPPRSRSKLELVKDPASGQYKCTTCGLCLKACPNGSIALDKGRDPVTKKWRLTKYEYHFDRCTLCGLCVEACKLGAIQMSQQFETAVFSREELVQILNDDYQAVPSQAPASDPANNAPAIGAPTSTTTAPADAKPRTSAEPSSAVQPVSGNGHPSGAKPMDASQPAVGAKNPAQE